MTDCVRIDIIDGQVWKVTELPTVHEEQDEKMHVQSHLQGLALKRGQGQVLPHSQHG